MRKKTTPPTLPCGTKNKRKPHTSPHVLCGKRMGKGDDLLTAQKCGAAILPRRISAALPDYKKITYSPAAHQKNFLTALKINDRGITPAEGSHGCARFE